MTPTDTVHTASAPTSSAPAELDEFELDLQVIESLVPGAPMADCDTSDGCGSTCATTACISNANDPF
ncbi:MULTISPECIES: FxLD family lanthipeptide [Pseudofrankia]|uniref:FxLD family lanthipeptide n=1 Tax=Pseudofrankia TaxID=2994363 RepID=UPI000234C145|nr:MULTISPECIES: FxLD family lanthipeptide [Pseudofrankia]OHV40877.1 hypothetical protein BCD49_39205 [Pseudofrankia sp. EUN1h]